MLIWDSFFTDWARWPRPPIAFIAYAPCSRTPPRPPPIWDLSICCKAIWRPDGPEYESRWKVGIGDDRAFVQRRWKGEPLGGERILLYAEQGFGDTLQFVRYVPLVAARGGQVVLEVQPQLRRLLSGTDGASHVISRGEALPEFTWQCPLLSLPLAFGTELNTIPARVPYVHPDPAQVEAWQQRLQGNTRRIGLVWGGNPTMHRESLTFHSAGTACAADERGRHNLLLLTVGPGKRAGEAVAAGRALDRSGLGVEGFCRHGGDCRQSRPGDFRRH